MQTEIANDNKQQQLMSSITDNNTSNSSPVLVTKLKEVMQFYNLTHSEICSILQISRMTLNELLYNKKSDSLIKIDKLNILYDIKNELNDNSKTSLSSEYINPLLSYLKQDNIDKEVVRKIVQTILYQSEDIMKEKKKVNQTKKHKPTREQPEVNMESFLFFMKMLSSFPVIQ